MFTVRFSQHVLAIIGESMDICADNLSKKVGTVSIPSSMASELSFKQTKLNEFIPEDFEVIKAGIILKTMPNR